MFLFKIGKLLEKGKNSGTPCSLLLTSGLKSLTLSSTSNLSPKETLDLGENWSSGSGQGKLFVCLFRVG